MVFMAKEKIRGPFASVHITKRVDLDITLDVMRSLVETLEEVLCSLECFESRK